MTGHAHVVSGTVPAGGAVATARDVTADAVPVYFRDEIVGTTVDWYRTHTTDHTPPNGLPETTTQKVPS